MDSAGPVLRTRGRPVQRPSYQADLALSTLKPSEATADVPRPSLVASIAATAVQSGGDDALRHLRKALALGGDSQNPPRRRAPARSMGNKHA